MRREASFCLGRRPGSSSGDPRSRASRTAASDPKAVAIADKVMQALGGADAWNETHYLRFDFAVDRGGKTLVRRAHTWDKWTGRYRLEAKTKDGDPYVVLMNVNTKEGSAFLKGKKLEGDEAKKAVDEAYGTWVNDTYWLIMPYKMKDPGVILALDGEETKGGETLGQGAPHLRQRRPDPEGPLLGLRQPQDPPRGPLGVRPQGREQAAVELHLEELEALRQDPARGRPGEPRRDADLLPGPRGAPVGAGGGLHDPLTAPRPMGVTSLRNSEKTPDSTPLGDRQAPVQA